MLYSVDNSITPLKLGGNSQITITGGPSRSIQVNSPYGNAVSLGTIDLSGAGPNGTGADFAVVGPVPQPGSTSLILGTGKYVQPAAPINDPFANLAAPTQPSVNAPAPVTLGSGDPRGCSGCPLYVPGLYPSGINVNHGTSVFMPGVYYLSSGDFAGGPLGNMVMCASGCGTDPNTGSGMMVFLKNGAITWGSNSNANLKGSDPGSTYKGILFFADHNMSHQSHSLGGGGSLSLTGTIYMTNSTNTTSSKYQEISGGGNACSSTLVKGEVIADTIKLSGTSCINMQLDAAYMLAIDQIALVK